MKNPTPNDVRAERIREIEQIGASIVALANCSGRDPRGTLNVYRERVLQTLRGVHA